MQGIGPGDGSGDDFGRWCQVMVPGDGANGCCWAVAVDGGLGD